MAAQTSPTRNQSVPAENAPHSTPAAITPSPYATSPRNLPLRAHQHQDLPQARQAHVLREVPGEHRPTVHAAAAAELPRVPARAVSLVRHALDLLRPESPRRRDEHLARTPRQRFEHLPGFGLLEM